MLNRKSILKVFALLAQKFDQSDLRLCFQTVSSLTSNQQTRNQSIISLFSLTTLETTLLNKKTLNFNESNDHSNYTKQYSTLQYPPVSSKTLPILQ